MSGSDQPQRQVLRLHGRDHLPGGSDPIPGLKPSPLEFMVAYGNIDPGSGATPAYIDLTTWSTSSEDVFTLEFGTGGLSAIHGVAIHEEGVYRVWSNWTVDSATAADTIVGGLDIQSANTSFWDFGNTQNQPNNEVVYNGGPPRVSLIRIANLLYIGGAAGPDPVLLPGYVFANVLSQGAHAYNVEFELLIERLATAYTSNVPSHLPV